MTPEKKIQNLIIDYFKNLKKMGLPARIERRQAGGFSYKMGIPDLYAVYNGYHIEIEVKSNNGQLRPMQIKWKEQCIKDNTLYICAKSLDDVKNFMYQHFKI